MEDQSNRTEQPTGKHRGEARSRGQVARSMEISNTAAIAAGLVCFAWFGPMLGNGLIDFSRSTFSTIRYGVFEIPGSEIFFIPSTLSIAGAVVLWTGILFITALVVGFSQVGFQFSSKAFELNWDRLNPVSGMQKLFTLSSIVRALVAIFKLMVILFVSRGVIEDALNSDLLTRSSSPVELVAYLAGVVLTLGWRVTLAMVVIATADYAYQRYSHEKNLKMTKEEVREEGKQSEGDPQVRGKIRSVMFLRHRQRMMQEVPKATVIVTNPTHVAIALRYDRENMKTPKVVAKGLRLVAERIKEIARENNVPIFENKPLARGLYRHCKLGTDIPVVYYQAVASVLAQVYRLASRHEMSRRAIQPPADPKPEL